MNLISTVRIYFKFFRERGFPEVSELVGLNFWSSVQGSCPLSQDAFQLCKRPITGGFWCQVSQRLTDLQKCSSFILRPPRSRCLSSWSHFKMLFLLLLLPFDEELLTKGYFLKVQFPVAESESARTSELVVTIRFQELTCFDSGD